MRIAGGKQAFTVHKTIIVRRSKYFRNMLMSDPTRTSIDLNFYDLTDETLNCYMLYLYSGIIQCQGLGEEDALEDADCRSRLIDFYDLASRLEDGGAMDAAVSGMIASAEQGYIPSGDTIKRIYAVTKSDSPFRRLIVDMHVWRADYTELSDMNGKAFLLDLAKASLRKIEDLDADDWHDNVAAVSCCKYHQHSKGETCLSKKRKRDDEDHDVESQETEDDEQDDDPKESTTATKEFKALQLQVKELQKQVQSLRKDK